MTETEQKLIDILSELAQLPWDEIRHLITKEDYLIAVYKHWHNVDPAIKEHSEYANAILLTVFELRVQLEGLKYNQFFGIPKDEVVPY